MNRFLITLAMLLGLLPAIAHAQSSLGMTRAEFVQRVLDERSIAVRQGARCFADVGDQTYAPAVCTARQLGFVTGDPSGRFRPHDRILLVEAAAILVRAEGTAVPYDPLWYRPYIDQVGKWNAFPSSLFNIYGPLTYAQATEMIDAVYRRGSPAPERNLKVQITASDDTPEPGDQVTFRIRIENTANTSVQNLRVSAELESLMRFLSSSDGGDEYRGTVEWDDIRVNARSSKTLLLTVDIDDAAREGERLDLRVEAGNAAATRSLRVDYGSGRFELRIDMSDSPDPVNAGEELLYRITFENDGQEDTVNVRAYLDQDTDFVSATDGGRRSGNTVLWDNLRVYEDEERTVLLRVRADDAVRRGDRLTLRVEADGAEASESTYVEDDWSSTDQDVRIDLSDSPDSVWRGDQVTYRITIENLENRDITTDVRAVLDENLYFLSGSDGATLEGGNDVFWENLRIARDGSRTLTLVTRVSHSVNEGDTLRLQVEAGNDEETETTHVD